MKRILVPTDFSDPARKSFKFALDLAGNAGAEVIVVHMVELPVLPETTFGIQPPLVDPGVKEALESKATQAFERMKREYPSDVRVSFKTIHDYIVPAIRSFVSDNHIDLIVMSTHGASGLDEFFIGSKAEKIARFSPVPVIAIPREIEFSTIKNIVFPTTLEFDQEDLVSDLKELQRVCHARLHVLLISTPGNFYNSEQATKQLERFARHFDLHNFTLNFRSHQFERRGILDFMNEIKGDMVAMATHGRTGLAHFLRGSIAESVLNRIDHPIWTRKLKT